MWHFQAIYETWGYQIFSRMTLLWPFLTQRPSKSNQLIFWPHVYQKPKLGEIPYRINKPKLHCDLEFWHIPPCPKMHHSWKFGENRSQYFSRYFVNNVWDAQTDRQTDRQTDTDSRTARKHNTSIHITSLQHYMEKKSAEKSRVVIICNAMFSNHACKTFLALTIGYLRRRLASEGRSVSVCASTTLHIISSRHVSLGGEGNALGPVLSASFSI